MEEKNRRLPFPSSGVNVNVEKIETINIHPPTPIKEPDPPQSKDDTLKARVEPRVMEKINSFCAGRKITRSDFVRHQIKLDPEYFDHIDLLNDCREQLIPLLKRMSKAD